MTYKYWNGSSWVRCSREEAGRRHARGQRVLERPDAPAPKPKAKAKRPPVATPVVAPPKAVPPAANTTSVQKTADAFDLSDEELEKLTAPGANSEG